MADAFFQNGLIFMPIGTEGVSGNINLKTVFKNSKWRTQYGKWICKQLLNFHETWYLGVFGIGHNRKLPLTVTKRRKLPLQVVMHLKINPFLALPRMNNVDMKGFSSYWGVFLMW